MPQINAKPGQPLHLKTKLKAKMMAYLNKLGRHIHSVFRLC